MWSRSSFSRMRRRRHAGLALTRRTSGPDVASNAGRQLRRSQSPRSSILRFLDVQYGQLWHAVSKAMPLNVADSPRGARQAVTLRPRCSAALVSGSKNRQHWAKVGKAVVYCDAGAEAPHRFVAARIAKECLRALVTDTNRGRRNVRQLAVGAVAATARIIADGVELRGNLGTRHEAAKCSGGTNCFQNFPHVYSGRGRFVHCCANANFTHRQRQQTPGLNLRPTRSVTS